MSLNLKPSCSRLLRMSGTELSRLGIDQDVALRRDNQVGGQILAAHVVQIAGDSKWRDRRSPLRILLRMHRRTQQQGPQKQCPAKF